MERLPDPLALLAAGVPLSLLIDLTVTTAPDSEAIYAAEPADLHWLDPAVPAA